MAPIIQHLRATSDSNGNPRRLWAVYDSDNGNILEIYDEGYAGMQILPLNYRRAEELPEIDITIKQYNELLKWGEGD